MEFTKFDATVIFALSLAMVIAVLAGPSLGIIPSDSKADQMPEFNVSGSDFDVVGEAPESPGTPSSGKLWWTNETTLGEGVNIIWMYGDTPDGLEVFLDESNNSVANPQATVTVNNWSDGTIADAYDYDLDGEGDSVVHTADGWEIRFEMEYSENSNDRTAYRVSYVVVDQPSDKIWLDRIVLIGGLWSAANELASITGWIGSVLFWGIGQFLEGAADAVSIFIDSITWAVSTMHWLLSGYFMVVSGATGWASALLTSIGIILFAELAKLVFIGVNTIR